LSDASKVAWQIDSEIRASPVHYAATARAVRRQYSDSQNRRVLVDCGVHFIKASGRISPKVFKISTANFAPQETVRMENSISLAEMTTRKHYPGTHKVDAMLNGSTRMLGTFKLTQS
jgi:hypothetical protein